MESEQRKKQAGEKIEKLRQESSTSIKDNEDRKKGQKEESEGKLKRTMVLPSGQDQWQEIDEL